MPLNNPEILHQAAAVLKQAKRVLAITGAGISADCGLPTYRGKGGLYAGGATADGMPIEEALSGRMLSQRPELTWNHIGRIESACRGASPSAGHKALVQLASHCELTLLTQNIDGFHTAAGSDNVIEIHGNIYRLRCPLEQAGCDHRLTVLNYAGLPLPPLCPQCNHALRPDVVLFGEMLPEPAIDRLYAAMAAEPEVVLSIGTTSVFPYIAAPVLEARRWGGVSIEINPGVTEVSAEVDFRLEAAAADVLPALLKAAYG